MKQTLASKQIAKSQTQSQPNLHLKCPQALAEMKDFRRQLRSGPSDVIVSYLHQYAVLVSFITPYPLALTTLLKKNSRPPPHPPIIYQLLRLDGQSFPSFRCEKRCMSKTALGRVELERHLNEIGFLSELEKSCASIQFP